VTDAERGAQVSVEAVTVGIVGGAVRGMQSRDCMSSAGLVKIDQDDLIYAVEMASDVMLERDRMILHALPQDFVLDGRAGFRKPQMACVAGWKPTYTSSPRRRRNIIRCWRPLIWRTWPWNETVLNPWRGLCCA
jgi:cell division protein FtsA